MKTIGVSNTKLGVFRSCKRRYWYTYVLHIAPKVKNRGLYVGDCLHRNLEAYSAAKDWKKEIAEQVKAFDKLTSFQQEALGLDFEESLLGVMGQYEYYYGRVSKETHADCKGLRFIELEKPFETLLFDDRIRFNGKIDGIVEYEGKIYILERKTFGSKPMSMEDCWLNQQGSLYIKAAKELLGYDKIAGVIWDMVKSTAPAAPNVLKNKKFGVQSGYVTSYSFRKFVKERRSEVMATDEEIRQLAFNLEGNEQNYLRRFVLPLNKRITASVWNDFKETCKEMYNYSDQQAKNIGIQCQWCDYRPLCQAEATGADVDYVIKKHYEEREGRDDKKSARAR